MLAPNSKLDEVAAAVMEAAMVPECGVKWEDQLPEVHNLWRAVARAGVKALREPSVEMMDAPTWYDGKLSFTPGDAEEVWKEMIDVVLDARP